MNRLTLAIAFLSIWVSGHVRADQASSDMVARYSSTLRSKIAKGDRNCLNDECILIFANLVKEVQVSGSKRDFITGVDTFNQLFEFARGNAKQRKLIAASAAKLITAGFTQGYFTPAFKMSDQLIRYFSTRDEESNRKVLAELSADLGMFQAMLGQYGNAEKNLARAIADLDESGPAREQLFWVHMSRVLLYLNTAKHSLAQSELEAMKKFVSGGEITPMVNMGWVNLREAMFYWTQGEFDKAESFARKAGEYADTNKYPFLKTWSLQGLGMALKARGRLDQALLELRACVASANATLKPGDKMGYWLYYELFSATALAGMVEEANRHLSRIKNILGDSEVKISHAAFIRYWEAVMKKDGPAMAKAEADIKAKFGPNHVDYVMIKLTQKSPPSKK